VEQLGLFYSRVYNDPGEITSGEGLPVQPDGTITQLNFRARDEEQIKISGPGLTAPATHVMIHPEIK
jgi:hypothetical protein